jgi:hypothetical protein
MLSASCPVYRVFFDLAQATESYVRFLDVLLVYYLLVRDLVDVTHPDACQLFFRENVALIVFV